MPTCATATWIEILPATITTTTTTAFSVQRSDLSTVAQVVCPLIVAPAAAAALVVSGLGRWVHEDELWWTRFRCGHGHLIIHWNSKLLLFLCWSFFSLLHSLVQISTVVVVSVRINSLSCINHPSWLLLLYRGKTMNGTHFGASEWVSKWPKTPQGCLVKYDKKHIFKLPTAMAIATNALKLYRGAYYYFARYT